MVSPSLWSIFIVRNWPRQFDLGVPIVKQEQTHCFWSWELKQILHQVRLHEIDPVSLMCQLLGAILNYWKSSWIVGSHFQLMWWLPSWILDRHLEFWLPSWNSVTILNLDLRLKNVWLSCRRVPWISAAMLNFGSQLEFWQPSWVLVAIVYIVDLLQPLKVSEVSKGVSKLEIKWCTNMLSKPNSTQLNSTQVGLTRLWVL